MNKIRIKFIEEAMEAISNFPDLELSSWEDSLPNLVGSIKLYDKNRDSYDSYFVKIECTPEYPYSFPLVYETQGRLPHNIDWHVYGD